MCGLIGYATANTNGMTHNELDVIEQSLILNALRGDDSTGAVCIDKEGVWAYRKQVGGPKRFLDSQWGELRRGLFNRGKVIFGHGRAATRGTVTVENAHPFCIKRDDGSSLILVHNGTLHAHQSLPGFSEHDVDSEWLAKTIATIGAEEALSEVNGAIATIWWDTKDLSLNFYRNYERPLWTAIMKSGALLYNSEPEIMKYLAFRYKLEFKEGPYELAPYMWCKVKPTESLTKWDNKKVTRKVIPTTQHGSAAGSGVQYGNFTQRGRKHRQHVGSQRRLPNSPVPLMQIGNTASDVNPYESGSDDWMLVEGHANFIEWDPETGVKKCHYMGGTWEEEMSPPKPETLRKMYYRPEKRQIVECHQDGESPDKVQLIVRDVEKDVEALEGATTPDEMTEVEKATEALVAAAAANKKEACVVLPFKEDAPKTAGAVTSKMGFLYDEIHDEGLAVTFRKGKPARWHTRNSKGHLIRHMGISEPDYPTFFSFYQNDEDGKWNRGQQVNVEYCYSETIDDSNPHDPKTYLRAYCATLNEKMELAMDFVFTSEKWNRADLKKIGFFRGTINWMRVLNKDEREKSKGTIVQVFLTNVEPLENGSQISTARH